MGDHDHDECEFADPCVNGSFLVFVDVQTGTIYRASLDGSNITEIVDTGRSELLGIAVDEGEGKIYFAHKGHETIERVNVNGGCREGLVSGIVVPEGVELDKQNGKMYYTDAGDRNIRRANLDGTGEEILVTDENFPRHIALDIDGGKMYWTQSNPESILRANLDGSGREVLVTGGSYPYDLEIDVGGGKMYWVALIPEGVRRANLDGSGEELLHDPGLDDPEGLAIDRVNGYLYWTLVGEGYSHLVRSNLDGTGVTVLSTELGPQPNDIELYVCP
jgi:DNA-binding beta-propeller fold protein YncE